MNVIKRDGRKVEFDREKIKRAVLAAFSEVDGEESSAAKTKASEIARYVESLSKDMSVEEIQDIVEDKLMSSHRKDVAKAYVVYRNTRSRIRDRNSAWMKAIKEKLSASNVQNQNANVDEHSFGGRKGEADAELTKKLALDDYMSEMSRNNHLNNEIYIHDLDSYVVGMHNCTDGDGWITIKDGSGKIRTVQIKEFANEIVLEDGQIAVLDEANYSILSRDGWTKLNNITRRKLKEGEPLYTIKTKTGLSLNLTGEHRLPVIREGEEILKEVKDLAVGDVLLTSENVMVSDNDLCDSFIDLSDLKDDGIDIRIFNISPLKNYIKYKYGVIFSTYAENNFEYYTGHTQKSIKLSDFKKLISRYPVSFDVLSRLKISASGSKHKYPMLIPYSSELAKLYAYIYSDGSVYENEDGSMFQVCFTNTNEEMIDDFIKCFETCFGRKLNKCYPTEQYAENNSPCIRVHCGDRIIVRLFKDYAGGIMNGSQDLRIPDFVMNGPEDVKYAYLSAAVDSDGNLNTHNINITTCCKSYAEQLSMIMNSLGYHSTVVLTDKAGSTYHFNKSSRTGIRNFDSYKVMIHRDDEKADLYAKMNTIKVFDKYSYRGISNKFAESKITAIVPKICPEESVYDLETASHWFILNNYVSHNCLTVPFDKLLANGFNTRQTDVRPAQSINTAFQLVAVIFQLQSLQQFGGVSASHLDWTMVPYVRKSFTKHLGDGLAYVEKLSKYKTERFHKWLKHDENHPDGTIHFDDEEFMNLHPDAWEYAMDMTAREANQAAEALQHNLNTLQSRSGNQLPFTSINYGTCTLPEGRMIIKALLKTSIKGNGKLHKTPIFPCGIFQYMKGVNDKPGTPNYDLYLLALESTAKRLYPNYANVDWSGNAGYDRNDPKTYFSTMGCRTANGMDINGFGQLKDGRGNICPVTIIMPTLAMEAKNKVESDNKYTPFAITDETTTDNLELNSYVNEFMELLDKKIHEAKDMLIERFDWICSQSPESAKFMYENGTMEGYVPEEGIRSALKHGTIVIGQLGLAETLQILIGCDHTEERGMKLAKKIEQLFKDRCAEFKQEYKLNFGVYYTPAENLCYTAMNKFKAKYGIIPNVSDREFFTNSMHVPVWKKISPFEKIDIESQLTGYSSAGCITYVELDGGVKNNIKSLETIVNYAMDHDIPYFAVNVPNDTCLECGYTGEFNDKCPICGSTNIQQLRRVTGYLTGNYKTAFNKGKQQEVEMRVKHT